MQTNQHHPKGALDEEKPKLQKESGFNKDNSNPNRHPFLYFQIP